MRRLRWLDWLLLVTLLPLFFAMLVGGIRAHQASGEHVLPFRLSGAQGADGYPLVVSLRIPHAEIRPGDLVLRIGGIDLRGLTYPRILYRTRGLLAAGAPLAVEAERDGSRLATRFEPLPAPFWWWPYPTWIVCVLVASFTLVRAPHWHLRRIAFLCLLAWACFGVSYGPTHPLEKVLGSVVAVPLALALTLWFFLAWAEKGRPGAVGRALTWAFGIAWLAIQAPQFVFTAPTGTVQTALTAILSVAGLPIFLGALVRTYARSEALERRQLRWIVYTTFLGSVPVVTAYSAAAFVPHFDERLFALAWSFVGVIPIGFAVAIVGYGWLDIDRAISASAAATVVGVTLLAGLLAVVPPLANAASGVLDIDPETARLAFSVGLAIVLVPSYQRLRPWLDRWMFAEQHALAERFEALRTELGAARGVEEMATRAGAGLEQLMKPESVAIYGRAGEAFAPLFQRGKALPPAFEAGSMLVQVLEAKREPLFARSKELGPFERAALETLGAEVVAPLLRGSRLMAFTCLGAKRSGDIYTGTDLSLLASVATRCGEVIERIDLETLARESQAMQSALRRYVPGAVAERLLAGDALDPTESEVTVLFVDIRGYTGMAEQLAARDVFATLNAHTERVSRIVQENGGTIVEFNGDGMMAVFGAPDPLPKKEQAAVEAARNVVDSMPGSLSVGVGVATGPAFVGSIRSTDRLIWSAVGSTTNLAARLQVLTRDLDASIALDATTHERAGFVAERFSCHPGLAIRGRSGRFDVFALPLERD
jgi:class 3 adenylate cyclase